MQRLGLDAIDFYMHARQLGWAGHVARMDFERLPRRMLSCWVPHKRPRGAPRMTYGRTIGKALDMFDINPKKWPELAADRAAWRGTVRGRRSDLGAVHEAVSVTLYKRKTPR